MYYIELLDFSRNSQEEKFGGFRYKAEVPPYNRNPDGGENP
jgi:hypothetical protein